jgi:ppGpp synthetase/RelA/SpoT-type nucleotidyltranferase
VADPNDKLDPKEHARQIAAYAAIFPEYDIYAKAFHRVLERARDVSFPEAFVQARAKTVSSFAEKVARKWPKYRDAVNEMTDLCGARIIVQTAEQVSAVCLFVEANFNVVEREDKQSLLSQGEFGYRDMHFIVQLKRDRAAVLGFTAEEVAAIGTEESKGKRAELQVRTWLQHAWADTLHDRMYKNKLNLSREVKRTGALLAALMEEGDRNFNALAGDLDSLIANYTAFASKQDVAKEIDVQQLILDNEVKPTKKPALAVKLANLVAATGDLERVVAVLGVHSGVQGPIRCELLLALGYYQCMMHRGRPESPEYDQGCRYLRECVQLCADADLSYIPNPHKRASLHARALLRLAWALSAIEAQEYEARACFRHAHEQEPDNPYYLTAMLCFEMRFLANRQEVADNMATTIRGAIRTCRAHAIAGIELPYAYFAAGRLSLLLGQGDDALDYYARGVAYCRSGRYCVPAELRREEISQIQGLHRGQQPPPECRRVIELLRLAHLDPGTEGPIKSPALIVAGGAAGLSPELAAEIRKLLARTCGAFKGTIISGGTACGVPGCVGDAVEDLGGKDKVGFELIGYLPAHASEAHGAYHRLVEVGEDFEAEQVLRYWSDILAAGIQPQDVLLLGFGGGALSAVEYRVALGLGASVAVITGTGGAADELAEDEIWSGVPNLFRMPFDCATVRAYIITANRRMDSKAQEEMAKAFHQKYVEGSAKRLPPNMRPWDKLEATFQRANIEQAHYSVAILEAAGFEVVAVAGDPVIFNSFEPDEVKQMAILEHGRWNVERLRDGWRFGKPRDDDRKIHDCIVPWEGIEPDIQEYDLRAVRAFPEILAKAGLEVRRPAKN